MSSTVLSIILLVLVLLVAFTAPTITFGYGAVASLIAVAAVLYITAQGR